MVFKKILVERLAIIEEQRSMDENSLVTEPINRTQKWKTQYRAYNSDDCGIRDRAGPCRFLFLAKIHKVNFIRYKLRA
jgi:hypothetical protein